MSSLEPIVADLLHRPPGEAERPWPIVLRALLCDLRPRFLPKGQAGRGYRAVARNGRVLLASDRPLAELPNHTVQLRLQTWHRAVLPGDVPEPCGILLLAGRQDGPSAGPLHATRLTRHPELPFVLALDVGGRLFLEFRRLE